MDLTSRQVMAFWESIRIRTHRERQFNASLNGGKIDDILLKKDLRTQELTPQQKDFMVGRIRSKIKERVAKARKNYG